MRKRIYSLDLLRIICCIYVIAIHIFMSYRVTDQGISYNILFVESFIRCCVPIFFMITGFFMFKKQKTLLEVCEYLFKRIIIPTLLLLAFIQVFSAWLNGTNTLFECILKLNFHYMITFFIMLLGWKMPEPNFWLWYITTLVKIYFFYPLLQRICIDKKEENFVRRSYLVICFLATIFFPTIKQIFMIDIPVYIYTPLPFYAFAYILIGYELSLFYERRSKLINAGFGVLLYICGSLSTYLCTKYIDIPFNGDFVHLFFNYQMLNVVVSAIGLIIVFLSLELKEKNINRWINILGETTFFVYLIHYPIIFKLSKLGVLDNFILQLGNLGGVLYLQFLFLYWQLQYPGGYRFVIEILKHYLGVVYYSKQNNKSNHTGCGIRHAVFAGH